MPVDFLLFLLLLLPASAEWSTSSAESCQGCVSFAMNAMNFSSQARLGHTILLGARNALISLDFEDQSHQIYRDRDPRTETGEIGHADYQHCLSAGHPAPMCDNYYKVLIPLESGAVLVCGTSAFTPRCDVRQVSDLSFQGRKDILSGEGLCPANPRVPVTFLQTSPDIGYAGTCRAVCNEYAISRMHLQPGSLEATARTFKTEEFIGSAQFVYSFAHGEYLYFLWRETALELDREHVYTRVGRLCTNDLGSSSPFFKGYFKTFLKSRLYCTSNRPGHTPFDHNELGGAWFDGATLYGVFSGPRSLRTGSILCSFPIVEIEAVFRGRYLVHDGMLNRWISRANHAPVTCDSHPPPYNASKVVLMAEAVSTSSPIASLYPDRLSWLVGRPLRQHGRQFLELFSSSEKGEVLRISFETVQHSNAYIQRYKTSSSPILSLALYNDTVYTMDRDSLTRIPPTTDCSKQRSCQSCLSHHYPSCGWCYGDGEWQCTESGGCEKTWLSPIDTCEPLPTFTTVPSNKTFEAGESAVLQCQSNSPFSWINLPGKAQVLDNGFLFLPVLGYEDNKCYTCSMNNTSGVVSATACLTVLVSPSFTEGGKPPDQRVVPESEPVVALPCAGIGTPPPTPTWQRLGGSLPEGSVQSEDGTLHIYRVLRQDEGSYRCILSNSEGEASATLYLTVTPGPEPRDGEPGNGTEEQLNSSPEISSSLLIAVLTTLTLLIIVSLLTFLVCRRRKGRSPVRVVHELVEQSNPLHVPYLESTLYPPVVYDEARVRNGPLTELDEAPPAYTEHAQILPMTDSPYHQPMGEERQSPFHPPPTALRDSLYMPAATAGPDRQSPYQLPPSTPSDTLNTGGSSTDYDYVPSV